MSLTRLSRMSFSEILGRSRQELSKAGERLGWGGPLRRAPVADLAAFRERARECFFIGGASDAALALWLERMPWAAPVALGTADAARNGRFCLLGRTLSLGFMPDWHLEPLSGQRSPLVHWSLVRTLDPQVVGDSKVVWELNRHQWLVALGQAYRVTGDEGYARAFVFAVQDWIEHNPVGVGINWASSLEVSLRIIAWSWALVLFSNSPLLDEAFLGGVLGSLWAHARHVERYLSYYYSPNTHLTGEALGLFYAGSLFPELRGASRIRALGGRILEREAERQVLSDGVYFEQSTCYARYTVEILLHYLILARTNGDTPGEAVDRALCRMLDFLLSLQGAQGSTPPIGDADGGFLLPLYGREQDDLRGVFGIGAALFGRDDYAWAARGLAPEIPWLLGAPGVNAFDALVPSPPETPASRVFPKGGYAVMSSGWSREAHRLVFDMGPLGCPVSSGHGHADLLSIQCSAFGEPVLVDPGTFTYTADTEWRNHFRSTRAHNTLTVDGKDQAEPRGPFGWTRKPAARLLRWQSSESVDVAEADHDAYGRVRHKRRVVFAKPDRFLILDDVEGDGLHDVEIRYQFAPLQVFEQGEWVRAVTRMGRGFLLRIVSKAPLEKHLFEGAVAPPRGWVSQGYGDRRPAPALVVSARGLLPLRIATLLLPVEDPDGPLPDLLPVFDEAGLLSALGVGGAPPLALEASFAASGALMEN